MSQSGLAHPLLIENLEVTYGTHRAVKGVSFHLEPGEVFGLLGPNGAGKTSIISSIMTLLKPSAGVIRVFGNDSLDSPDHTKRMIGCVPQELIHHGYFPLDKVLDFYSTYFGLHNNQDHIRYLLETLELWDHRKKLVSELSGGMKRRVLIAKALIHKPRIVLLDEPTAGVDVDLKYTLWKLIRKLREDGVSILLTTHYLEEAEALSDRIGILRLGELIKVGHLHSLLEEHGKRDIILTLSDESFSTNHEWFIKRENGRIELTVPKKVTMQELLSAIGCPLSIVTDIKIREGNLEDAFLEVLHEA